MSVVMTRPFSAGSPFGPLFTWEQLAGNPIGSNVTIRDISYDDNTGRWAIITDDFNVAYSDDGVEWHLADTPLAGIDLSGYISHELVSIRSLGGQWFIVGSLLVSGPTTDFLILTSTDAVTWTKQSTTTDSVNGRLSSIAYDGSGMYVAVGGDFNPIPASRVFSSPDGVTWTPRTGNIGAALANDIVYGNGIFTIVGGNSIQGKISTSSDGITWTAYAPTFSSSFTGLAFHTIDDIWVATSPNGESGEVGIITSLDNWSSHTQNLIDEISFVEYANGSFVAVTGNRDTYTSTDGLSWTGPVALPYYIGGLAAVTSAGGYFNYVGNAATILQSTTPISGLYPFMKGRELTRTVADFISGVSLLSATGINNEPIELGRANSSFSPQWSWNTAEIGTALPDLNGGTSPMVWTGGNFVLIKESVNNPPLTEIATSTDGIEWTQQETENTFDLSVHDMAYDVVTDVIVAVGSTGDGKSGIISSSDQGVTWTARTVPGNEVDLYLGSVCADYNGGLFIATGILPDFETTYIITSPDGTTWTRQADIPDYNAGGSCASGNGRVIIAGYGVTSGISTLAISSNNGASFAVVPFPNVQINRVTFLDGFFFFTGLNQLDSSLWIATSYRGTQFTTQTIDAPWVNILGSSFYEIAGDGARYLVGGTNNLIYKVQISAES